MLLDFKAVKTSNNTSEQAYKILEESEELSYEISRNGGWDRIIEETFDVMQACFTMLDGMGIDIQEEYKKHRNKMAMRGWAERD